MKIYKKLSDYLSRSIVISWIISYIIILSIPTVCNIYIYRYSLDAVKNRIYENDSHMLAATSLAFDKILSELANIAVSVQNSKATDNLITAREQSHIDINSIELATELQSLKNYNKNIKDIFVYFPCSQTCVSANYFDTAGKFFARNYADSGIDQNHWLQRLNKFTYFEYMTVSDASGNNYIDFFYSIPLRNEFNKASVIIRLADELFYDTVNNYTDIETKNIYIVDKNNDIIFSHVGTPDIDVEYGNISEGLSLQKAPSGSRYVSISKTSDANHWKYISVTPYSDISKEISYIRIPIFISFILCFIVAAILIRYFTKHNYKPIQKILSVVKHTPKNNSGITNEYELINEIVNKYVNNSQKINRLISSENATKKSIFLTNLAKGYTNRYGDIYEEAAQLDISFVSDYFAIMIFKIINADNLFSGDSEDMGDSEKLRSIEFIITNVFEELLGKQNKGYVTEFDGKLVCIANISNSHLAGWSNEINLITDEARSFIEENFNFSFAISMSRIHKGFYELPNALAEASKAMSYCSLTNSSPLVAYEDIARSPSNQFYTEDQERRLMNFIRLGNSALALETVYDMLGFSPGDSTPDVENLHLLIFQLSAVVLKVLFEDSAEGENVDYTSIALCLDELMTHKYTLSYDKSLEKLISTACQIEENRAVMRKKEIAEKDSRSITKNADELMEQLKEYIDKNLKDSELNIASIGYHFGLTPYYLSNVFKKSEGISLLDYISKARIALAKQIMEKSDISLAELASSTGFSNPRTFMRSFKKFEGITPGQYKELVKNQKNND